MKTLPLRAKFALIALLNLVVLGVLATIFVRRQLGQEFQSLLMTSAREKIVGISRQLSLELVGADAAQREQILARHALEHRMELRLYETSGRRLAGPGSALPHEVVARIVRPTGLPPLPPPSVISSGPPPFLVQAGTPPLYWIGVRTLIPSPDIQHPTRATLLLVTPALFGNPFFFDWEPWLVIGLTGLAVTLLCWFPLVRGLTRDIRNMTQATAAIADGQFDVQLETRRGDELDHLGRSINQMATRLRDYVDGQRRFLGDVAHELRSPLGRMQVAIGILERKTDEEDSVYVHDLQEDVEILSGLTTELLTFARSELKKEPVDLHAVPLLPLVKRAVQIESEGLPVRLDIDPAFTVTANENLLFRVLSNLVRNAARYAATPIEITARKLGTASIVTVADHGPGVPPEALEKIFTPFFRLDSARERKKGGTGLGLAIVRNYVEICGGSVVAHNREEGGLEVVVTLP
ncbi:MAG TPA: HAMP domain-containing sensor histidine kinase [Bryobacteraceae bacterium]|nr:HAMP domain-containing sensor histidine kinase [Bryobacteraceae bacterium]